jgi:formylglycine-generating enzyme required for sulfatase activity
LQVNGGTYYRTYDDVSGVGEIGSAILSADGGPTGEADPATVSGFRLDKYLVTVGRFRPFVNAVMATNAGPGGYVPPPGSGKHAHLNGGKGLTNSADPGGYESGWISSDDVNITLTTPNLLCYLTPGYATWTASPGSNENLPINCVNWYEAYAFCIWDGGFLPSEAEWEYVAAGGSQQREFPWGSTAPGTMNQYAIWGCHYNGTGNCTGVTNIAPVGTATRGAGLWGQLDLSGEVDEWNFDSYAPYASCTDCAYLTPASARVNRGGTYGAGDFHVDADLFPPRRHVDAPTFSGQETGLRCARTP